MQEDQLLPISPFLLPMDGKFPFILTLIQQDDTDLHRHSDVV